ncbi:MAG: DJ-1/PfpI family protein [Clostridia bacterium]|nr:DJ-1/PfpI family protein [Clostridia bacterium]
MIYLFLADVFEETEAITPLDLIRRAGGEIRTVGVPGTRVTGSHGITVEADLSLSDFQIDDSIEMLILPGGMPGTVNLDSAPKVHEAIRFAAERGLPIGAICAAPSILGRIGLLSGHAAVCYPGFEDQLIGAEISAKSVVVDENLITAKGMGVALEFGLCLVEVLFGEDEAKRIRESVQSS